MQVETATPTSAAATGPLPIGEDLLIWRGRREPWPFEYPMTTAIGTIGEAAGYGSIDDARAAVAELAPPSPPGTRLRDGLRNGIAYVPGPNAGTVVALELSNPVAAETFLRRRPEQVVYRELRNDIDLLLVEDGRGDAVARAHRW